ncbi:MAG: YaiO family outer membrane beta-barrel protein [Pseudomonadota bacterium]
MRSRMVMLALAVGAWFVVAPAAADSLDERLSEAKAAVAQKDYVTAEERLRGALGLAPGNEAARFDLARVLAWQEKFAGSLAEYRKLLVVRPDNVDYLLGYGQTLLWSGDPVNALAPLGKARAAAPDYFAIWRVEASALLAIGTPESRARYDLLKTEAARRFDARDVASLPAAAPPVAASGYTDLVFGGGFQDLSDGRSSWNSADVGISHQFESGLLLYGSAVTEERFDIRDETLTAGLVAPVHERVNLQFEVGAGAGNQVLPRYSILGGGSVEVASGFIVSARYKRNQYRIPKVEILTLGLEQYWADFRFELKLDASSVEDSHQVYSRSAALDYYYGNNNFIGVAGSSGSETEFINSQQFLTRYNRSLSVRMRHWVDPSLAVELNANRSDVGDVFTRHGFRLGLRWRH